MPLEIRELIIRVTVQEEMGLPLRQEDDPSLADLKKSIVRECVEEVLHKLEKLAER